MTKADLEKKIEGQTVLIEQQRDAIKELTEKLNDTEPIDVIITVPDLSEDSIESSFYINGSFSPKDVKLLNKVFKIIQQKTGFYINIFKSFEEEEK